MNEHTLQVLEFDSILSILEGFATSHMGKSLCKSLTPKTDIKEIQCLLDEVSELKEVLQVLGDIPIGGIRDVKEFVIKSRIGGITLDPFEFLDILSTIKTVRHLKVFFGKLKDCDYPLLTETGKGFLSLPDVESKIEQVVGPRGDILDSASPELKEIRGGIKGLRTKIQNSLEGLFDQISLQSFFQEKIITIRNGRYVIPVKSDFKGHIQGIIHDHSHSKATYFVEPIFTIELNNKLGLLFKQEKNEELRVLKNLSKTIHANSGEIIENLELLGKIDLTYAKARYSIALNANKPALNEEGRVSLINSCHPLLLSNYRSDMDVVPIDIHLDKECNILIITGANTGGKTVALKTLGVLTLMVQAGMHICAADYSEASIFRSIFADIGDEQDIGQNLSSFSSHISQIVEILGKVDESSLVLLDEIGVGTDPNEGAALAMALLDYFREKESSVITTTHLNLLKSYAYLHKDVMNVSVEFDPETMEPRYRLIYGVPGESNALLISETLGIPQGILDKALGYMENNDHVSNLIRGIENYQRKILEEKEEIRRIKESTLDYHRQMESLVEKVQKKREGILSETQTKAAALLRRTEYEVKEIVAHLKNKDKPSVCQINDKFQGLKKEIEAFSPPTRKKKGTLPFLDLKIGDVVRINTLDKEGIVLNASRGSGQVEVLLGNLKVKVCLNDLEQGIGKRLRVKAKREISFSPPTTEVTDEINVVGMKVFDALPLVDKAIDSAVLFGLTKLYVIHGIGTGRLRKAIRDRLKTNSQVEDFDSGDLLQGGAGITVVNIRTI